MDESQNSQSNPSSQNVGLKEQFTTVTPLSKFLAMALFIALPFIGFWFGLNFKTQISESVVQIPSHTDERSMTQTITQEIEIAPSLEPTEDIEEITIDAGNLIDVRSGGNFPLPDMSLGTILNLRWTSDEYARSWGDVAVICLQGLNEAGDTINAKTEFHNCVYWDNALIGTTTVSKGEYSVDFKPTTPLMFESTPSAHKVWIYVFDNLPSEGRTEWAGMIIGFGSNSFYLRD